MRGEVNNTAENAAAHTTCNFIVILRTRVVFRPLGNTKELIATAEETSTRETSKTQQSTAAAPRRSVYTLYTCTNIYIYKHSESRDYCTLCYPPTFCDV